MKVSAANPPLDELRVKLAELRSQALKLEEEDLALGETGTAGIAFSASSSKDATIARGKSGAVS